LRVCATPCYPRKSPKFQSHAGSIEAISLVLSSTPTHLFQSHAGSIEAKKYESLWQVEEKVSIPRWFD